MARYVTFVSDIMIMKRNKIIYYIRKAWCKLIVKENTHCVIPDMQIPICIFVSYRSVSKNQVILIILFTEVKKFMNYSKLKAHAL